MFKKLFVALDYFLNDCDWLLRMGGAEMSPVVLHVSKRLAGKQRWN